MTLNPKVLAFLKFNSQIYGFPIHLGKKTLWKDQTL